MKRIKGWNEFLNEGWGDALMKQMSNISTAFKTGFSGGDKTEPVNAKTNGVSLPVKPEMGTKVTDALSGVSGNDDFVLYMQHQQGIEGAKGLLNAAAGLGKIHPATLAVKSCKKLGGKVPYANLQCNIPDDKQTVRQEMVKALDSGDQKKGATVFLKMWKEKWSKKQALAKTNIAKPENSNLKTIIEKWCKEYGVPFDFAITVAWIESEFNPKANNGTYKGIFSLTDAAFKKLVPGGNIFNANDNCKAGIKTLKDNIKTFTKELGGALANLKVSSWATA